MNKIEKLIEELCPQGVEFKALGEIGEFYSGLSGKNKNDFSNGNAKFVTYMNIFSNISVNIDINNFVKVSDNENQNEIEYGDVLFTGSSETPNECGMSSVLTKKIDEPMYLNSFCFGYRLHEINLFSPEFLKYLFRDEKVRKQIAKTASGVTRFNISKKRFAKIQIPIPPLAIQKEIVNILDNFTRLEAELKEELEAELEARKKQYEYYREALLTFGDDVEWTKLNNVAEIGTGSSNTNEGLEEGLYPFFVRSQIVRYKNSFEFDETAIITSGDGVGVGKIYHYVNGKYALHQRAYRIRVTKNCLYSKFLFYYMKTTFGKYILGNAVNSSVTSVRRPMLNKYPIPIPPLSKQKEIVAILDKFDALVNDISTGLPAEITARKKQYEYYRNQLLEFKVMSYE